MDDYHGWTKEKLIEHIKAYSAGLHEISGLAMKQMAEIRNLRRRLELIHGA